MLLDYAESRRTNSERRDFWVYIGILCGFGDFFSKISMVYLWHWGVVRTIEATAMSIECFDIDDVVKLV